jgi:hypothetical protein
MKSPECNRRVGRTKEPHGSAPHAIPKPDRADRRVENIKIPEFPVRQSLKKFFYSHFECAKISMDF